MAARGAGVVAGLLEARATVSVSEGGNDSPQQLRCV